ncbi:MAG: type II toxin-antitoxin system VapC family toxin [Planctomycetes bacterium]|nr:type II toxin-antitoxin system VapC family toxin [Planctomycetota bacterium]
MAGKPSAYVLDSFALLAYLEGEVGMARVREVLEGAEAGEHNLYLSLINLGEVLYITEREKGLVQAHKTLAAIDQLPVKIVDVSRSTVLAAAHIKAHHPISYADAFAVVTARDYDGIIITGDPELKAVAAEKIVIIDWLPRH